ncbi:hypothetical protein IBK89_000503 [Salmonella enterica]|nr:hypothetical protein [Salmonella enterica]EJK3329591.1 hypothetical protein [Salmonella enterica]
MTQRIAVFPADRHSLYEEHGYSAAIRSGDLLFVSGQKQEIFALPPYPNWTAVGVTWLAGFDFEIKVIARIP